MNRRGFILGSSAILTAPAIVRASSLMPVSVPVRRGFRPAFAVLPSIGGDGVALGGYGRSPLASVLEPMRRYTEMLERLEHVISVDASPPRAIKASPYWRT